MASEPDAGDEPGTTEDVSTSKETSDSAGGMPKVTIRMSRPQLEDLDEFVDDSRFTSRSEAIRAGANMVMNRERGGA